MHGEATGDADRLSGDEARIVTRQEADDAWNILGLSDPLHRDGADESGADLLAALVVAIFARRVTDPGVMAPSFFVAHEDYRRLLEKLTGHPIAALKLPGWAMRWMGRIGDVVQRFGRDVQLTYVPKRVTPPKPAVKRPARTTKPKR